MAESLWYPSTTPTGSESQDTYASTTRLTLGTLFLIDAPGTITGVAFYRSNAAANTSVTVGLYKGNFSTGEAGETLVASKTATVSSTVGWKTILFDTPVAVATNDHVKAAMLLRPDGTSKVYYLAQTAYFSTVNTDFYPSASGDFKASNDSGLGDSANPYGANYRNGLWVEDATGALANPVNHVSQTNYWVDILYVADAAQAYTLTASTGSLTLTGSAAGKRIARKLPITTKALTLTKSPATLKATRKLSATTKALTLTGQEAVLDYSNAGVYAIIAETGNFALTKWNAALTKAPFLRTETGYFTLTGYDAGLGRPSFLTCDTGSFSLTGIDVAFSVTREIQTSGAKDYQPDIAEYIEEAFERCGLEARTGDDLRTARRSLNLLLAEWANRGLNHWTVETVTRVTTIVDNDYVLGTDTIDVLAAVVRVDNVDRPLTRLSQTDWLNQPNKSQTGVPAQFYVDRQINPRLKLWPSPDREYTVLYDRLVRMDKAANNRQTVQVPFRFYPCLAAGLAYYISLKKAPDRTAMLKQLYEEEFARAASEDRDRASFFIIPAKGWI